MNRKLKTLAALAVAGLALAAGPAAAYIGPGAGLSLLGALWGVLAAIFVAVLFLVAWPLRRLLRRRRGRRPVDRPGVQHGQAAAEQPHRRSEAAGRS
jgi:membrane protein implicated in regulation of membrane protease activity